MDKTVIEQKIYKFALENFAVEIKGESDLKTCGIDSLSLADLIFSLEEEFNISFTDDDLDPAKLQTGEDLILLISSKL